MSEVVRLLLFPLIAVVAWFLTSSNGETARRAVRVLSITAVAIFLVILSSGIARSQFSVPSVHKWSGHALVIAVWLFVPFSAGVGLQINIRRRPGLAISQTIVLLSLIAIVLLASFTGYLGPSQFLDLDMLEETTNRFVVLHMFILPSLVAALLTAWYWLFRPHPPRAEKQSGQPEPPMTRISNP